MMSEINSVIKRKRDSDAEVARVVGMSDAEFAADVTEANPERENADCSRCGRALSLLVCHNSRGWYLGYWCIECGSRRFMQGYFDSMAAAYRALRFTGEMTKPDGERLINVRLACTPRLEIRGSLWELVQLQDNITHMLETGQTDCSDFQRLKDERSALIDKLTTYVESLEQANGCSTREIFEL